MESTERLQSCIENKDWDSLVTILKPKDFCCDTIRTLNDFIKLLKVAELLVDKELMLSDKVKIVLLKCLTNSCVSGYLEKEYVPKSVEDIPIQENIYKFLSQKVSNWNEDESYPFHSNFPYNGIVKWIIKIVIDYAAEKQRLNEDQTEILRLSLQFLCNFFTFAFNISTSSNADDIVELIKSQNFKRAIIKLVGHDRAPIARAACAYFHNMVKQSFNEFYATTFDKKKLTTQLIKSTISDIQAALDTVILLLKEPNYLKDIYDEISIDDRLYLLDIIHQEVRSVIYNENQTTYWLPIEAIKFLSDKMKKKRDLILRMADRRMNELEPTEVTILLDILGVLTSNANLEESKKLQEDKSLLINCIFLLKDVQFFGKESNNCFTPLQKLSDLSLSNQNSCNTMIQSHPTFGFKASLIRVIGNLVYKHKKNQNYVRETDGISLLLDCCNIDARNPLIIQWTTLAIRNLVENNPENQEVIHKSVKLGVVDSSVIRDMGLTLHDDGSGNAIGIVPLPEIN